MIGHLFRDPEEVTCIITLLVMFTIFMGTTSHHHTNSYVYCTYKSLSIANMEDKHWPTIIKENFYFHGTSHTQDGHMIVKSFRRFAH